MIFKPDWIILKNRLMIFILILLVCTGLYILADKYNSKVAKNFQSQERAYNEARKRYQEAEKNRVLYRQYLENYQRYNQKGLVGEEHRLSWIEELQQINKDLALPNLSYAINPREKADFDNVKYRNNKIQINLSTMELQVGLLHEGDLFWLLQALKKQAAGFYSINACTLKSRFNRQNNRLSPRTSYLDAKCQLDWITVNVEG